MRDEEPDELGNGNAEVGRKCSDDRPPAALFVPTPMPTLVPRTHRRRRYRVPVPDLPPLSDRPALSTGCPRCGAEVRQEFYGPCASCVDQLRATVGREPVAVVVAAYEPKMNVTPNFVATKD